MGGMNPLGLSMIEKVVHNRKEMEMEIRIANAAAQKNKLLLQVMTRWMKRMAEGRTLEEYFHEHGIKSVAVYGLGAVGDCLVSYLSSCLNIKLSYGIDRGTVKCSYGFDVYAPEDELPETDVIIVTPISEFERIKEELSKKNKYEILSLGDIIFSL